VVWLLRQDSVTKRGGLMRKDLKPLAVQLTIPGLEAGQYTVHIWDTRAGHALGQLHLQTTENQLAIELPKVWADVALAVVRA
jgi:hypothetical protein